MDWRDKQLKDAYLSNIPSGLRQQMKIMQESTLVVDPDDTGKIQSIAKHMNIELKGRSEHDKGIAYIVPSNDLEGLTKSLDLANVHYFVDPYAKTESVAAPKSAFDKMRTLTTKAEASKK